MKLLLITILLSFSITTFSQKKITFFFETNVSELNPKELKKFNEFIKTKNLKIQKIVGYCDLRSSSEYNEILALKRANSVSELVKVFTQNNTFEIESKGENFHQNKNLKLNRKVEIYFKIEKATTENNPTKTIDLTNKVKVSKIGDKLVLQNMNFYDRTDVLYPESFKIREELLQILKDNPKLKIQIQGHICCAPGKDKEEIALKRCIATFEYLVKNGIDKNRLSYKSFDSSQPIFPIPEKTEEERKANRRVEILILDK